MSHRCVLQFWIVIHSRCNQVDDQEQPSQLVCMDPRAPRWSRSSAPSPEGEQVWRAFPLSLFVSKMKQLYSFKASRVLSPKESIYSLFRSKIWSRRSTSDRKVSLELTQASHSLFRQHMHLEKSSSEHRGVCDSRCYRVSYSL